MEVIDFLNEWRNGSDFIECHTSGSTGAPKKILLPKEKVRESALRTIEFFGLTKESRLHLCISPDFIGGKMMIARAETLGCGLTWEKPSNRPLESDRNDKCIDLLAVVPSQLRYIIDNINSLPDIKNILSGGGPIDSVLKNEIVASGLNVYESYGMTETSSHIAIRKVENGDTLFRTLGDITVSTSDSGCLVIDMPGWQRIETNDIAETEGNRLFRIIGRKDNVIISGGKKFFPEKIERLISPFVPAGFAVSSLRDAKWGEKIVCVVEGSDFPETMRIKILADFKANLPHEIIPKEIIAIDKIPLTESGKINRVALRELLNKNRNM